MGMTPSPKSADWLIVAAVSWAIGIPAVLEAQDQESPKATYERLVAKESINKLANCEVDWKETGFGRAGPTLVGKHARAIDDVSVKYARDLLPLLEKDETFIVAHVLLTRSWRVSQTEKEHICIPHGDGYVVVFNGLAVTADWSDVSGELTKRVSFPDLEQQRKRISYWWKSRYRDFPSEFSPRTLVD